MEAASKLLRVGTELLACAHRYAERTHGPEIGDRQAIEACIEVIGDYNVQMLLGVARSALVEKYRTRYAHVTPRGMLSGFKDPEFIDRFGPGMHKLKDVEIIIAALAVLTERVNASPEGKTGIPLFDGPFED